MADPLSRLIASLSSEIDHLSNGLNGGQLSAAQWHNSILQELADYSSAAYLVGSRAQQLGAAGRQQILRTLADQAGYLSGLTDAVEAGALSDTQIRTRAKAYAGSIKASYYQGAAPGLPFYPTQECECNSRCQCRWVRRGGVWYWVLGHVATQHCPTCRRRADGSPYEQET